jgi:integrase
MARTVERLTALGVDRIIRPGMYADGNGLYLRVTPDKTKNWVYRYMLHGRPRWMGLGPLHTISLADARIRAADCRKRRYDGIDPIETRRAEKLKKKLEAARAVTFKQCCERFIAAHRAGWHNAKHASQWTNTLATYVEPELGKLPVQEIDTALVMKVLEPIWATKPETASRVRQRIEAVLDWAAVKHFRTGENPARWRGHLEKALPARSKVRRVEHHAALPYSEMGTFMAALHEQEGVAARALEFAILTAARTSEVLLSRWSEFEARGKPWIVPADRMKAKREHRVPLSARAVEIIDSMKTLAGHDPPAGRFVFPGAAIEKPLSNMALLMLLRRMGRGDLTVHGFRSTFRDWVSERTNYPSEVAEMALAHTVASKVEAAYRRGDLFERRRRMMADWSTFCAQPDKLQTGNNVAPIRGA